MWSRVHDTFGARAERVGELAKAYIQGFQGKDDGVNPFTGAAATVKHFPGSGPSENGMDSHTSWGRFAVFPGDNFAAHIDVLRTAIQGANPAFLAVDLGMTEEALLDMVFQMRDGGLLCGRRRAPRHGESTICGRCRLHLVLGGSEIEASTQPSTSRRTPPHGWWARITGQPDRRPAQ